MFDQLAQDAVQRCREISGHSEVAGEVTRRFCTPPMKDVHQLVGGWMSAAGMQTHVDDIGNLVGRKSGTIAAGSDAPKRLLIGSHLDTVPNAGKFDGVLGVMIGLAVVESLADVGLPFGIEIIGFADEEGSRYLSPYLGSRAITGTFDHSLMDRLDADGISLRQAVCDFGLNPDRIDSLRYDPAQLIGYLEAHIEQGPILERSNLPVAIVDGFVGQSRLRCSFHGEAGHAGTVPMDARRDASIPVAHFALKVQSYAGSVADLRATIGELHAWPGASNVIPSRVQFSLDVRHIDDAIRKRAVDELLQFAERAAAESNTRFEVEVAEDQPAISTDETLTGALGDVVENLGHKRLNLCSGAGHDALVMAEFTPTSMLFIRNAGGISHCPEEHVETHDIACAIQVLNECVRRLANDQQVSEISA